MALSHRNNSICTYRYLYKDNHCSIVSNILKSQMSLNKKISFLNNFLKLQMCSGVHADINNVVTCKEVLHYTVM